MTVSRLCRVLLKAGRKKIGFKLLKVERRREGRRKRRLGEGRTEEGIGRQDRLHRFLGVSPCLPSYQM